MSDVQSISCDVELETILGWLTLYKKTTDERSEPNRTFNWHLISATLYVIVWLSSSADWQRLAKTFQFIRVFAAVELYSFGALATKIYERLVGADRQPLCPRQLNKITIL